jgi:lysozyme
LNRARVAGAGLGVALAVAGAFEGITYTAIIPVPGDVPTICRGHTRGVTMATVATPAECEEWFADDMGDAFAAIDRRVKVNMPETRRGALASFIFNVGEGAFARSTLLKKLNAGDWRGACNELPKWIHAGGKKLKGLARRRAVEQSICLLQPEEMPLWKYILKKMTGNV